MPNPCANLALYPSLAQTLPAAVLPPHGPAGTKPSWLQPIQTMGPCSRSLWANYLGVTGHPLSFSTASNLGGTTASSPGRQSWAPRPSPDPSPGGATEAAFPSRFCRPSGAGAWWRRPGAQDSRPGLLSVVPPGLAAPQDSRPGLLSVVPPGLHCPGLTSWATVCRPSGTTLPRTHVLGYYLSPLRGWGVGLSWSPPLMFG